MDRTARLRGPIDRARLRSEQQADRIQQCGQNQRGQCRQIKAGCMHNGIEKTILAEDFHGTAPDGSRYSKQEAVAHALNETSEEACTMYELKAGPAATEPGH
jgi:hypothetical protein